MNDKLYIEMALYYPFRELPPKARKVQDLLKRIKAEPRDDWHPTYEKLCQNLASFKLYIILTNAHHQHLARLMEG